MNAIRRRTAMLIAASALTLSGTLVVPTIGAQTADAASCKAYNVGTKWGRSYNMWQCGGSFHAELRGGQAGDVLIVKSAVTNGVKDRKVIPKGKTKVNSKRINEGPNLVCFKAGDRPGEYCVQSA